MLSKYWFWLTWIHWCTSADPYYLEWISKTFCIISWALAFHYFPSTKPWASSHLWLMPMLLSTDRGESFQIPFLATNSRISLISQKFQGNNVVKRWNFWVKYILVFWIIDLWGSKLKGHRQHECPSGYNGKISQLFSRKSLKNHWSPMFLETVSSQILSDIGAILELFAQIFGWGRFPTMFRTTGIKFSSFEV